MQSSAAMMARMNCHSMPVGCARTRASPDHRNRLSLRREFLIGEGRCVRHLDDDESVIGRRVAGVASFGEVVIGLIELTLVAELDRDIEQREGLRQAASARSGTGKPLKRGTAFEMTAKPCRSSLSM